MLVYQSAMALDQWRMQENRLMTGSETVRDRSETKVRVSDCLFFSHGALLIIEHHATSCNGMQLQCSTIQNIIEYIL